MAYQEQENGAEGVLKLTRNVSCDLCGNPCGYVTDGNPAVDWAIGHLGSIDETCVSMELGYCDRDGGGRRNLKSWHICSACFAGKLMPWLQVQGAQPTVKVSET